VDHPQKHIHPPEHGEMAKTRTAPDPRIAYNLRKMMEAHKMKQLALSERSGVGQSTISRILNGEDSPAARTLTKLAAVFSAQLDDFFREEGHDPGLTRKHPLPDTAAPEPAIKMPAFRNVPVVGAAKLDSNGYFEQLAGDSAGGHVTVSGAAPSAYALRVRGDALHPVIRDGWVIVAEPDQPLTPGEFVVVGLQDGRRMVRELLFERPDSLAFSDVASASRTTFRRSELAFVHAVGPVFPPSRWQQAV
jgi:transcriptional regulator with XRE-family HTH domain